MGKSFCLSLPPHSRRPLTPLRPPASPGVFMRPTLKHTDGNDVTRVRVGLDDVSLPGRSYAQIAGNDGFPESPGPPPRNRERAATVLAEPAGPPERAPTFIGVQNATSVLSPSSCLRYVHGLRSVGRLRRRSTPVARVNKRVRRTTPTNAPSSGRHGQQHGPETDGVRPVSVARTRPPKRTGSARLPSHVHGRQTPGHTGCPDEPVDLCARLPPSAL